MQKPKVVVLPLGLYVKPNQQKSIDAFAKLGVSKLSMLLSWIPLPSFLRVIQKVYLPGIFDRYREGKISTQEFRKTTRYFGVNLKPGVFDKAWNELCELTDYGIKAFDEAQKLIDDGIDVVFISGTNPLHVAHIEKQYGKRIPGMHFFSYQQKALSDNLISKLLQNLLKRKDIKSPKDIAWFYAPADPAPYAHLNRYYLGWLRWLLAPFKSWFHASATKEVNKLLLNKDAVTFVEQDKTKEPGMIAKCIQKNRAPDFKVIQTARMQHRQRQPSLRQQVGAHVAEAKATRKIKFRKK